jgi:hypothetical protein
LRDTAQNRELVTKAVYLYKIAFEQIARQVGGHVSYGSQHSVLWGMLGAGGFDPDFWLGVCAGLSIEWLKARASSGDLLRDLIATRTYAVTKEAKNRPNMESFASKVEASQTSQRSISMALKGILEPVSAPGNESKYPFTDVIRNFPTRRYFYISSGSHAMAAHCDWKGSVTFYDPNVGEISGTSRSFFRLYFKAATDASRTARLAADPQTPDERGQKIMRIDVYRRV